MAQFPNDAVWIWPQVWILPKALASHFTFIVSLQLLTTPLLNLLAKSFARCSELGTCIQGIDTGRFQTLASLFQPSPFPNKLGAVAGSSTPCALLQFKDLFSCLQTWISHLLLHSGFSLCEKWRPLLWNSDWVLLLRGQQPSNNGPKNWYLKLMNPLVSFSNRAPLHN